MSPETEPSLRQMTKPQKAAAIIVALGMDKASRIYKFLSPQEVEQLTIEVMRMRHLDPETSSAILDEYYQMCIANKAVAEGGLGYARSVLEEAFDEQTANNLLDRIEKYFKNRKFAFLDNVDGKTLLGTLQYERPQTIALILSYVVPEKSAEVIQALSNDIRVDVLESMANMENISPHAIAIVEAELEKKFTSVSQTSNVKVGGIDNVADIMNNMDRSSERAIFDLMERDDAELAAEIRKHMFVFEDIMSMDDRSIQRFLRDVDRKDLVLALKASDEPLVQKIFSNMSVRMADSIRDDLEVTTNVRVRDAEAAQQRIEDLIRKLEEKDELIIQKGKKDDIIA